MIASFNTQTVKPYATNHNSRKHSPHYLLIHDCKDNEFKSYISDRKVHLKKAQKLVKDKTGRSMQKSSIETFWQEAVINITYNSKLVDVENLFKQLNKEFKGGFEISEIAIHKDEGIFLDTTLNSKDLWFNATKKEWIHKPSGKNMNHRVIAYSPNQDIFYNKEDKEWYFDKEYTSKAQKMQKYFNYHAHVVYNRLNWKTGKMLRLSKKDMTKLQDITAESLGMTRGKSKQRTNSQRRNPHQLKQEYKYDNDLKRQHQEEIKNLRAELLKQQATREDYSKLEELNRNLKEQIKSKDLTIERLREQIEEYKYSKEYVNGVRLMTKDEVIEHLEKMNGELKQSIIDLKDELEITKNRANAYFGLNKDLNSQVIKMRKAMERLGKESNIMKYEEVDNKTTSEIVAQLQKEIKPIVEEKEDVLSDTEITLSESKNKMLNE